MPSQPSPFFAPAGRFIEILVGLLALSASGLLGYFGAHGAWMYLHGSRAAPASPFAATIGLGVGIWGGYAGVRMIFGWRQDRPLVPAAVLLVAGTISLVGGVLLLLLSLFLHLELPRAIGVSITLVTTGVAGIRLGWRRGQHVVPE